MKAPMPVDVGRGVRARERDPEEVRSRPRGELAVVDDHDQREAADRVVGTERPAERGDVAGRRGDRAVPGRPGCRAAPAAGSRKPSGRRRPAGSSAGSVAAARAGGGDHDLRALVQAVARVVERVDRRPGLEVQVVRPVDALEQVAEERRRCRGCRGRGRPRWATISRYFASDSCPWPRIALALVSSSCGRRTVGVGDVALAADRQQQRMDAGGVDGVDGVDAGDHGRDDRPGQLVDQLAERRVLLRRPADRR